MFAELDGVLVEVVSAGAKEIAKLPYDLAEGLYVVGTGSSGAAEAMMISGALYFTIMFASAMSIYSPHPSYKVAVPVLANTSPNSTPAPVVAKVVDLDPAQAVATPQFKFMGLMFFCIGKYVNCGSMGQYGMCV